MSTKDNIIELLADGTEWSISSVRDALPDATPGAVAVALIRLPEPMTEDELLDKYAHTPGSIACALRAVEAETLRRVREANNAVVMLGAPRLPEPLTDDEVDALIDETKGMETDRAVRYLVETGVRRVKEANK